MNDNAPELTTYHCPACGDPFSVDPARTQRHTCRSCGSQHKFTGKRRAAPRPPRRAASQEAPSPMPVVAASVSEPNRFPPAHRSPSVAHDARPASLSGLLGNVIWIVFGGGFMALGYYLAGVINFLTLIGIPAGLQCFKLGDYSLMPFGKQVATEPTGCFAMVANVLWFFTGGLVLAVGHLCWAVVLLLPIVTWPFAVQHFRLAELAIFPFGRRVVSV
jgi:uncharacterized membrane protein YccF (DUF307 family)/DNA-directed RNA polymerase subunit RPC12/RpoP